MVTSRPSSTQATPNASTTRQCQRDQGKRSSRAGMLLPMAMREYRRNSERNVAGRHHGPAAPLVRLANRRRAVQAGRLREKKMPHAIPVTRWAAISTLAGCALGHPPPAQAETLFSAYTGTSYTRGSDLRLTQPGLGTDLTLHDVRWDAHPFRPAPY